MKVFNLFISTVVFSSYSSLTFGALIRRNAEQFKNIEDEVASPQHRQLTPLTCNDGITWNCQPWKYGTSATDVLIPCGECYTMDSYVNDEVITLTGTLRVQGRLEFNDGTKVTLKTTGVLVEGELAMTSTKPVDGIPDIVIELTGTTAFSFPLHSDNAALLSKSSLSVEPKSFLVLGKVDINGLPDSCPTWSTIESFIGSGMVQATSYPQRPTLPVPSKGTCDFELVKELFENGLNGWHGNVGAEEYIGSGSHDGTNYLHITNRTATFQGPMLEVNRYLRECIIPDTDYFFNAKIRLSAGPEAAPGTVSECSNSKLNCPQFRMSHMNSADRVRWRTLAETKNNDYIDGDWISVKAVFRLNSEQVAADDVFTFLIVNGPEAGIDISIDDISISLPPAGAYPDPNNVCANLVQNGDASVLDGFTFPMRGYLLANPVFVKTENGNQYFSIANRKYAHDNLVFDIVPECLEENSVYTFSMKIRIHSATEVVPNVILKFSPEVTGEKPSFAFVARDCPATSTDIGWVTCTSDMTFKAGHSSAPRVEVLILIQDDSTSDVDYDDISFVHKSGAPSALRLHEVTQLENCWAPGADVALPSETLNYEQGHAATIEAIVEGNGVDLVETLSPAPTSRALSEDFAVEMALLSRNILFKSGDSTAVGPTLQLLYSNTPQKIQGVEFNGFGQEGKNEANPIYFANSNNSTGSVIAKNSIRNSKNRCVHLDKTSNVLIKENVAYETKGHCYSMSTTGEGVIGNVFEKNIGFVTRNAVTAATGTSDTQAATFFVSNPSNSWIDNAAGGSNSYGFWFRLQPNTIKSPITAFSGNSIHSSYLVGLKTFPQGLTPITPSIWSNSRVYRNRGHGIFLHNTRDITFDGFVLADNKLSIDLYMADKIFITNSVIRGYTEEFELTVKANPSTSMKHCWPKPDPSRFSAITGVRMHSNAKTVGYGTNVIANVTFADFNPETGCNPSSAAISTNPDVRESKYTGLLALGSLTFESGTESANMISLCDAKAKGITDISIPDSAGSINPNGNLPGFIVSDTGNAECVPMTNTCARYCADADASSGVQDALAGNSGSGSGSSQGITSDGICLSDKWVAFRATVFEPTSGPNGEAAIIAGDRIHQQLGGFKQDFASACLTKGKSYEITADVKLTSKGTDTIFSCNTGTQWNNDPESCAGFVLFKPPNVPLTEVGATYGSLTEDGWNTMFGFFTATDDILADSVLSMFVARAPIGADITLSNVALKETTAPWINECVKNGDAESGDHRFWMIRGSGPGKGTISMTDGYNSNYAFRHVGKTQLHRGILQYIAPSCFGGTTVVITAKFRYFNSTGDAVACDKDFESNTAKDICPVFEFAPDGVASYPMANEDEDPMVVGEWNNIRHTFTVTDAFRNANKVWLFVSRVPVGAIYDIDDVQLS